MLDVYTRPYDPRRPVVCLDETSKQLVAETRIPLHTAPGRPARHDYEYERRGRVRLVPAVRAARGLARSGHPRSPHGRRVRPCHQAPGGRPLPEAEQIVLVMDNLNTHPPGSVYDVFAPAEAKRLADKLEIHPTPKHGSWLNMAEIELSVLTGQCLDRRSPDRATLRYEVTAWNHDRNAAGSTINWRFSTADARIKLKHLYPTTLLDYPLVRTR